MFMGASLCTESMEVKELQAVMLVVDVGELTVNLSTYAALQNSISTDIPALGGIQKCSFSTVFINYP